MRVFQRIAAQPVAVVAASALFLVAAGVVLASGQALASHDDPTVVHVCVKQATGQARFVPARQAPNCRANETQVDLSSGGVATDVSGLEARLAELEGQVGELEEENQTLRQGLDALAAQMPDCLSEAADGTALFSGCDVQIVNGKALRIRSTAPAT